jgi:hypothetical protein
MNIRQQFAALATASRYPTLTWHTWAKYPGAQWVYLGASSMDGAKNTRGLVRFRGGLAICRELAGPQWGEQAVRREVRAILQQLNSGANDE